MLLIWFDIILRSCSMTRENHLTKLVVNFIVKKLLNLIHQYNQSPPTCSTDHLYDSLNMRGLLRGLKQSFTIQSLLIFHLSLWCLLIWVGYVPLFGPWNLCYLIWFDIMFYRKWKLLDKSCDEFNPKKITKSDT